MLAKSAIATAILNFFMCHKILPWQPFPRYGVFTPSGGLALRRKGNEAMNKGRFKISLTDAFDLQAGFLEHLPGLFALLLFREGLKHLAVI